MEYQKILKKSLLFSGLNEENLAEVAAIATKRTYGKGRSSSQKGILPRVFF